MIFKIEIIEASPGEGFVYQNPYPDSTILFASREDQLQEGVAWPLLSSEIVGYNLTAGAILYGKLVPKEEGDA